MRDSTKHFSQSAGHHVEIGTGLIENIKPTISVGFVVFIFSGLFWRTDFPILAQDYFHLTRVFKVILSFSLLSARIAPYF